MTVDVKVVGIKELAQGLTDLPAALGKGAIYTALAGAAKVVRDDAKSRAPLLQQAVPNRKPGTVRDAIRVRRSKFNKGQSGLWEVIIRVKPYGARRTKAFKLKTGLSARDNPNDPYYWKFLEFGTSKMAARPFLRPAFDTTKERQLEAMRARMKVGLEKAAAKIAAEVNRAT